MVLHNTIHLTVTKKNPYSISTIVKCMVLHNTIRLTIIKKFTIAKCMVLHNTIHLAIVKEFERICKELLNFGKN